MKLEVRDLSGKVVKTIDLPPAIYDVAPEDHVLHSVVKAYRANRRQGTHATKTRAFVSGGGKKPWKQKGTGGARSGSNRSPLWPGGAKAHGPQPRDYTEKLNRKLKQLALRMVLTDKYKNNKLYCVTDFGVSTYSTKHVLGTLKAFNLDKVLLADERKDDLLHKSARNIHGVDAKMPSEINTEDLLRYDALLISENGLTALHQRIVGG